VEIPDSGWFCIVNLNGTNRLISLGAVGTSLPNVLAAFLREWKSSEANAVKHARRLAQKNTWGQRKRESSERSTVAAVADAYEVVLGLLVPDAEGVGCTYYHFDGCVDFINAIAGAA